MALRWHSTEASQRECPSEVHSHLSASSGFNRDAAEVLPLFARARLRPVIDSVFHLADIRAAHQRLESNLTFGKMASRLDGNA